MLPETRQFRRDVDELLRSLVTDWGRLWPALDLAALDASFPRWAVAAAVLTGEWRATAVALAVEYLGELSDFPPVAAGPLPPEQFTTSMRVTTVVAVKRAMIAGRSVTEASGAAFSLSSGSVSRLVLNGSRETVMRTSVADPECRGWRRVGDGGCDFCLMLIGRGAVYSESSADFPSHGGCRCAAEPAY